MSDTPYRPAAWLPGPHANTVFANLARPRPRLPWQRERWELADGDFVDVDRYAGPDEDTPILVICHGLEGSSRTGYVLGLVQAALGHGLAVLAMNFRGCSGELNRRPRFYHSGETSDLGEVVRRLVAERPGRRVLLAGFSLGGNVVAKYLGEGGDALPPEVRGGAVISAPFDLERCAAALDAPGFWLWVYRERFLFTLRRKTLAKARLFPEAFDTTAIRAARTFSDYDQAVTAPLHGFASALDYWRRSSSARYLPGLRRPLLAIAASDDPMIPDASLPRDVARDNPRFQLLVTPTGGHVGFVQGPILRPGYWAEPRAAAFLAALAHGS
jgi:predicted alpha/beta-fold hydrolase